MAGSYCSFCDRRCFVLRKVPDGPRAGWVGHMATCAGGMAHDREKLGHDHTTAINGLAQEESEESPSEEFTNWLMMAALSVDPSVVVARTDLGKFSVNIPAREPYEGKEFPERAFTVKVEEVLLDDEDEKGYWES